MQERKRVEGEYDVTAFSKHGAVVSYAAVLRRIVTKQSLIRGPL